MIECVLVCLVHKIVKIRREQLFQTLSLLYTGSGEERGGRTQIQDRPCARVPMANSQGRCNVLLKQPTRLRDATDAGCNAPL